MYFTTNDDEKKIFFLPFLSCMHGIRPVGPPCNQWICSWLLHPCHCLRSRLDEIADIALRLSKRVTRRGGWVGEIFFQLGMI